MVWPITSSVGGLTDAKTRSACGSDPSSAEGLSPAVVVAASCNGIPAPQHADNFILIPGESYIPRTRIQPNGRNETAMLTRCSGTRYSQCLRRKKAVSEPPCEQL